MLQKKLWRMLDTKLTLDAIQYAECMGMKAIDWNYPEEGSLQDLVERSGLHPLTSLALRKSEKQQLIEQGLLFCKDLANDGTILRGVGINDSKKIQKIVEDAKMLCKIQ